MVEITIETEFIRLDQLLKFAGIAGTGGESKFLIKDGQIKVNDEVVYERGKKIKKGDKVEVSRQEIFIVK